MMDLYLTAFTILGFFSCVAYPIYSALKEAESKSFNDRYLAFRVEWIRKYYPELSKIDAYQIIKNTPMCELYDDIGYRHSRR